VSGHTRQFLRSFALRAYYNLRIPKNRPHSGRAKPWPIRHRLARPQKHVLCGYYDVTPFDVTETRCAALAAPGYATAAYDGSEADIGWFDLRESDPPWQRLGGSRGWCWQQGARLRWHPTSPSLVTYNDVRSGQGLCLVQDTSSGRVEQQLPMAIYDLAPDGRHGLSLDFHRLHLVRRGYGYPQATPLPADRQGVWLVNLQTARNDLLLPLSDLVALNPVASMAGAEHYVNHISWSPDGSQFVAIHLWLAGGRRFSRMIIMDFPGGPVRILENTEYAGHYCWMKAGQLLFFVGNLGKQSGFYLYDTVTGGRQPVAIGSIREDGHPSALPESEMVILDTYPDGLGFSQLFLLDPTNALAIAIGRFHHPLNFFGDYRCDLHPRTAPSGRLIAVDHVVVGSRVVSILSRP